MTGSLIRSSNRTGFNQVQTVTQQDILRSGAATVASFLRDTSANSGSSYDESTVDNEAPGGASLALRGLSTKYTLVLVDGQRSASYAFGSGMTGTDTFFDIDSVPLNMIDHIEIVKTGAVSEYGSDAIAGVVNIITKRNFRGLQVTGNLGGAQQGGADTSSFGVLAGFGDLGSDRFNVTTALNYMGQTGITYAQRAITSTENYLGQSGGLFSQPSSFFSTPSGPQALSPCGPGSTETSALHNLQTQTAGTVCSRDGASAQSIAAAFERTDLDVRGEFLISDAVHAFADVWGSHDFTTLLPGLAGFGPGALAPSLHYSPGTGFVPFAPTVGASPLTYYFPQAQTVRTTSNFYRISAGLDGSFGGTRLPEWDWSTSVGHSESDVSNAYANQIDAATLQNYLGSTTPSSFSPQTLDTVPGLFGTADTRAVSRLDTLDASISTSNLFKLPAGQVGLAFGTQLQRQSEYIGAGSFEFVNPYTQAVNAARNISAAYYQIDVPLVGKLSFSQSGRYDYYSEFGGVFSPRYALRYQPARALTLYASYSAGFRAPTLQELFQTGNIANYAVGERNVNAYFVGNPSLQPEHTKNYNAGLEWSPDRTTDFGFDWYRIDIDNVINQDDIATAVGADPGEPLYVLSYRNFSYLITDGFEATFKQALPTTRGTFTVAGDWAYVWQFDMPDSIVADFAGNNGANDTVFGAALPRWKGNTSLGWKEKDWLTTLSWQFTGPYRQVITAGSTIPSYSLFNLSVDYTGLERVQISMSLDNILDSAPPYDPVWTLTYRGYYDPTLYEDIGRFAQVGVTYTF